MYSKTHLQVKFSALKPGTRTKPGFWTFGFGETGVGNASSKCMPVLTDKVAVNSLGIPVCQKCYNSFYSASRKIPFALKTHTTKAVHSI